MGDEYKARLRAKYRATGRCTFCPQPVVPGQALCQAHAEYNREQRRKWRQARTQARGGMR